MDINEPSVHWHKWTQFYLGTTKKTSSYQKEGISQLTYNYKRCTFMHRYPTTITVHYLIIFFAVKYKVS